MKSLVSIIIVNWNGKENLRGCFQSLAKISYSPYEIILVDNGSNDGSVEMVKKLTKLNKRIKLIGNKENLGFAKANNQGFKKAKGKYILLLNSDTKVAPDFLTKLIGVMEKDEKISVVQPKIIFMDSKRLQAGGAFLTNTGFLYHYGYGKDPNNGKYNHRMEIFSANGSCMLVKREVIEKVGLFDPDFFCYFEETDFCWRVWLAGYKIVYVPDSVIYHKGAQSAQRLPISFIQYHSFKNRLCTYLKNFSFKNLFRIFLPHLLLCEISALAYLVTGKPGYTFAIQRAIFWNIFNLGKTFKKRSKIQQRIRQVADDAFIPLLTKKVKLSYYSYLSQGKLEDYEE